MTGPIDYAKRNEALLLHADVTATPYQRGFEDGRYLGVGGCISYRNPYGIDYDKWVEYDAGFMDARKAARQERI